MRFVSASALALAGALCVGHVHAQQAAPPAAPQDASRKVAGGGITAAGWKGKVDAAEAAKGATINDSKFAQQGAELRINNGPAAIYWKPADTASGSYTVSATFTEPKYMSSNDHPHPYGVFIGGSNLDGANANALYCAAYGRGTYIVREFTPAVVNINGRGASPSDAVHKAAGRGEAVEQTIAMSVKGSRVSCSVNGTEVASYDKGEVTGAGKIPTTDGIVGIRAAHNVDVNVKDFKITK